MNRRRLLALGVSGVSGMLAGCTADWPTDADATADSSTQTKTETETPTPPECTPEPTPYCEAATIGNTERIIEEEHPYDEYIIVTVTVHCEPAPRLRGGIDACTDKTIAHPDRP